MKKYSVLLILVLVIAFGASLYLIQNDDVMKEGLTQEEKEKQEAIKKDREAKREEQNRIIEDSVIIKKNSNNEYSIYTKAPDNRWVNYKFSHEVNEENTQDNWRIKDIQVGNMIDGAPSKNKLGLTDTIPVSDSNNTHEYAYKEIGADDHVGNSHGKEIVSELTFNMDESELNFDEENMVSGNKLTISKTSTLFSEMDRELEIAEVIADYKFDNEKMVLNTSTNWTEDTNLEFGWVSLFPFIRGEEQSNMFSFLNEGEEYDISEDNTIVPRSDENGGTLYNNENDLSVTIEVLNPEVSLNGYIDNGWAKSYVADSLGTNKLYIGRMSGDTTGAGRFVNAGETWNVEQEWSISMSE